MQNDAATEIVETQVHMKTGKVLTENGRRLAGDPEVPVTGHQNSLAEVNEISVDEEKVQVVGIHHQMTQMMTGRKVTDVKSETVVAGRTGEGEVKKVLLTAGAGIKRHTFLDFSS